MEPSAAMFTEDAHYVEHAYGEMQGRAAIEEWITKVMAPFPKMTFPQDWSVIDVPNAAVVFQCQNELPEPFDAEGAALIARHANDLNRSR